MIAGTLDYDRLKDRCLNLERLIAEKREEVEELRNVLTDLESQAGASDRFAPQGSTTDSQAERDKAARNLARAEKELQSLEFQFLYDQCEIVI